MGLEIPRVVTGLAAFCVVLALACFLAFRDQYREIKKLTRPRLLGRIISEGLAETSKGAGITVLLQITNTGPPTIADGWGVVVKVGESIHQFRATHFPEGTISFPDGDGGSVELKASELIYEKLLTPIPQGGRVSGFLFFLAREIPFETLKDSTQTEITVLFRDAEGREYQARSQGRGQVAPLYEPGVADPFIAINRKRRHEEIRDQLGRFLFAAEKIKRVCEDPEQSVPEEVANKWYSDVATYIRGNLGEADLNRFRSDISIPPTPESRFEPVRAGVLNMIHKRSIQLSKLLDELKPEP